MKRLVIVSGVVAALSSGTALAQSVDLTGTYTCVQMCRGDMLARVTQNGPELNLTTEAGVPSRAWPDWNFPATRIWVEMMGQSAVYTPDGMTIQFDGGTVWQRDLPPPPPPARRRR